MTPDRNDGEGPFLQRWSRRKRERDAAGDEAPPAAEQVPSTPAAATDQEVEAYRLQLERNREAAEAIDLASLNARSDLSPFFEAGVPKALRKAAMRALWRSDKVFANLDGLNDYDENFADPELVRKFTGTAWKIGKGYLFDDPEAVEERAEVGENNDGSEGEPPHEPDAGPGTKEADASDPVTDNPEPGTENPGEKDEAPTADHPASEPEKVPLRERLALDGWHREEPG